MCWATVLNSGLLSLLLLRLQVGRPATAAGAAPLLQLPDAAGVMAPAGSLFVDDAPWLGREGLRMVHPSLPPEVAQPLGAQSLRYHHQGACLGVLVIELMKMSLMRPLQWLSGSAERHAATQRPTESSMSGCRLLLQWTPR